MNLFPFAFMACICVFLCIPKSVVADVINQEVRENLEKKAQQGDAKAQLQSAIMNERNISNSHELQIHNLLKAKAYYKAACNNKLQKGCDGYNRLKKQLVKYDLFTEYRVNDFYKGPLKKPDFKGRDKAYRKYRTAITYGMQDGPNFAGKYSITSIGCGTGCFFAYIADNQTGKVIGQLPIDGELNNSADLLYHLNSRVVIASYPIVVDYTDDNYRIVTVYNKLLFNGKRFELLRSSYAMDDWCHFDDLEVAWYLCAQHW